MHLGRVWVWAVPEVQLRVWVWRNHRERLLDVSVRFHMEPECRSEIGNTIKLVKIRVFVIILFHWLRRCVLIRAWRGRGRGRGGRRGGRSCLELALGWGSGHIDCREK